MNVRFACVVCAAVVAYAPSLFAQTITDTGIFANNNAPTQVGELTIVREQSLR